MTLIFLTVVFVFVALKLKLLDLMLTCKRYHQYSVADTERDQLSEKVHSERLVRLKVVFDASLKATLAL